MDLIYADVINGLVIDRGVLNNFAFDLSFGEDENDFVLVLPIDSPTKLKENQVVYVPGTEYGGVIDSLTVDTLNRTITCGGRTWHGIIENKILFPLPGHDYLTLQGDANDVLRQLLERMNLIPGELNEKDLEPVNPIISVSEEEADIWIDTRVSSASGNYAHGYTFIRNILYEAGAKPVIIDGVLSAKPNRNYASQDDFIMETDQFRAKRTYNTLTRLHCLGAGELRDRHTIDLYIDENGGVLPYCRENPIQDSDYYTDMKALSESTDPEDVANYETLKRGIVTGINEISEIYDYSGAKMNYHYVKQTAQPSDWTSDLTPDMDITNREKRYGFQKYFMQFYDENSDEATYKEVEKPAIVDEYKLQFSMPADWSSNFADYFISDAGGYKHVQAVSEYDVVGTMPGDWYIGGYSNYFKSTGQGYTKVTLIPGLIPLNTPPGDWATNWGAYCNSDGSKVAGITPEPYYKKLSKKPGDWAKNYKTYYKQDGIGNYTPVPGKNVTKYKLQTIQPTDWGKNWSDYYQKTVNGKYIHVAGTKDKKAPKWKKNKYYTSYNKTTTPEFVKNLTFQKIQDPVHAPTFVAGAFYESGEVVPTWGSLTVYKKRTVPTWQTNKYYTSSKRQPMATWIADSVYARYEDHYEDLIQSALNKIEDSIKKDDLEIKLDERFNYQINDIVGASDEVTGVGATERIVQKIVKIKRGMTSFEYRTGK